ncbi:AI-2E family transporter [Aquirhabdus sp.]|uniref:AI-2E family transporter n=1 Tax=Aquirhabdus sp. TaxID=2824160 RepID=UPI00396CBB68
MPVTSMTQRFLLLILLTGLLLLSYQVLVFFISPVLWAAILAYVTWPLYSRLRSRLGERNNLSALLMTFALILVVGIPVLIGTFLLQQEARNLYLSLQGQIAEGRLIVPDSVLSLPAIGGEIKIIVDKINNDPSETVQMIRQWTQAHLTYGKVIINEISRNAAKLGFALMTVFFLYRDGDTVLKQIRRALHHIMGQRVDGYLSEIGLTTQAVVYGIGLTALAQALLAGIGYAFAGAPSPILLTVMTLLFALIPFGTPFAWGGVSLWLLAQGHTIPAIGLALWGGLVVSWVDNIIRPMVISGVTQVPFLLIMFGVLGGLGAFGLVGLFIGPVILAVLLAVWREWQARGIIIDDEKVQPEEQP